MNDETMTLREYLPFLALLLASVFVFSAMQSGEATDSKSAAGETAAANPAIAVEKTKPTHILPDPELNARAYLVKIAGEDDLLLSRRSWKPLPPASLTKLLITLVAYEELSPAETIKFSEEAKRVEEKTSDAEAGEVFSRNDIIRFALIESANDAALALAEAIGSKLGGTTFEDRIARAIRKINERAGELGMRSSNFLNPAGLDAENQYTTAEDLARLSEYIWNKRREIWENSRIISAEISSAEGAIHKVTNTNDLLKEFPAILGGKTGFTDEAKGTLVLLYPIRPNKVAIIVILGSDDRFGDGRKIIRWLEESFK